MAAPCRAWSSARSYPLAGDGHRVEIIVLAPAGVGDVVAEGPAIGLAAVDRGGDRGRPVLVDDEAVFPPEIAVEEIGVVVDVVVRGQQRRVDVALGHELAQVVLTPLHLLRREGRLHLVAIVPFQQAGHVLWRLA